MLPIMIILKLTGEHNIFYKQMRVGRYGKEFPLLKFATMLKDSPNMPGGTYTYKNDPRILPIGKFLRKTKINELPQLINILIGDMSIIGYRPLVYHSYEKYSYEMKQKIYNLKPGLSGIGSIVLRNEEELLYAIDDREKFYTNNIIPYKATLECWFVEKNSLLMYLKLIIITLIVVIKPNSSIYKKVFKDLPVLPKELVLNSNNR
jgi:lipopolysaccharide/colanic/teichoic acid biosynthesis glycosyltransferase